MYNLCNDLEEIFRTITPCKRMSGQTSTVSYLLLSIVKARKKTIHITNAMHENILQTLEKKNIISTVCIPMNED